MDDFTNLLSVDTKLIRKQLKSRKSYSWIMTSYDSSSSLKLFPLIATRNRQNHFTLYKTS